MNKTAVMQNSTLINLLLYQPSGANELVGGGNQADVKPDFAISGTFCSKFLHQSCLWDSQLKACEENFHHKINLIKYILTVFG